MTSFKSRGQGGLLVMKEGGLLFKSSWRSSDSSAESRLQNKLQETSLDVESQVKFICVVQNYIWLKEIYRPQNMNPAQSQRNNKELLKKINKNLYFYFKVHLRQLRLQ